MKSQHELVKLLLYNILWFCFEHEHCNSKIQYLFVQRFYILQQEKDFLPSLLFSLSPPSLSTFSHTAFSLTTSSLSLSLSPLSLSPPFLLWTCTISLHLSYVSRQCQILLSYNSKNKVTLQVLILIFCYIFYEILLIVDFWQNIKYLTFCSYTVMINSI